MSRTEKGLAVLSSEESSVSSQTRRAILRLAWPIMAETGLTTLTQIVDMAMVSRLGTAAIASVSLSFRPFFFATAVFMGLSIGTTALVARLCGSGRRSRASDVARQSLLAGIVMGLALAVLTYYNAEWLIKIMGGEPDVVSLGASYTRAMALGITFTSARLVLSGGLRGAGDTHTPMKVSALMNIVNIFGNWVLIFGNLGSPALGVEGAGLATSLAYAVGALSLFLHMIRPKCILAIQTKGFFSVDMRTVGRVLRIGVPAAMERVIMSSAQVGYMMVVAALGTTDIAAHAIAINAESISYMPSFALAHAAATLVGQNLGAEQPEAASRSGWGCFRLGALIALVGSVVLYFFPHWLIRIYTDDPVLMERSVVCLRVMALAQVPMSAGIVIPGALRGAGDTRSVLYVTTVGAWGVRLALAYLFVVNLGLGLAGAWMAMALDWLVRGLATAWRFRGGKWKGIKV